MVEGLDCNLSKRKGGLLSNSSYLCSAGEWGRGCAFWTAAALEADGSAGESPPPSPRRNITSKLSGCGSYAFRYDWELRLILLAARPGERKERAPSHQVVADLSEALALLRSRFATTAAVRRSGPS